MNPDSPSSRSTGTPSRLNLFAFPSLTTLLFGLIAGVILAAVASGLRQSPSALGLMIVLGMIVLPIRSFLQQVDRNLSSLDMSSQAAESSPPSLIDQVEEAARDLGLPRPPHLLIASNSLVPFTIGSWRRRYIAIGRPQVDCLAELPGPTRRAFWLHEVGHFANGDHWKVGLARSLLRTTIVFMSWSAFFLLGIVIMASVYGSELFEPGFLDSLPLDPMAREILDPLWPDPALTAPLLEKAKAVDPGLASLYELNSHLPFIFSGFVLLLIVWRRLVQAREFYADARVAAQVGDGETARKTLIHVVTDLLMASSEQPRSPGRWGTSLRQWLNRALPFDPSWQARSACLLDPVRAFGSWKEAGLIAGLTVLLLDLILVGPFTLGYLSGGPAHFVTLSGFVVLSVWLVPSVCQGFASSRGMMRQVAGAVLLLVAVRTLWLLLNTVLILALLVLDPGLLRTLFNTTVFLSSKVLTASTPPPLTEDPLTLALWALGGGWGFTLLAATGLFVFLSLAGVLLQRLLTWYAFPHVERHLLRIGWLMILTLALILGVFILPLPTAVILGDYSSLLQSLSLLSMGIVGLLAIAGAFWFMYCDRRYGRRCPSCNASVLGRFELGKRCPGCGQPLHPWLLANY